MGGIEAVLANRAGEVVHWRRMERNGGTVCEVFGDVAARYPTLSPSFGIPSGTSYGFVTFYLNDEHIRFRAASTDR